MNFQFTQNTGNDQNDKLSSSGFSIELDRISNFQEFYNSINKMTLKPDWNFIRNENEVVIYKIKSVSVEVPKLSVIIKVSTDLNIEVWVEEVPLDVKSSLWKLLGYKFEDDKFHLRYSMLLDLIRFLDVNQILVTNRKQKWQLNSDDVIKAIRGDERYCQICFKTIYGSDLKEIDTEVVNFVNEIAKTPFLSDESLSKLICQTCEADIEEFKGFRSYLHQAQTLLETTLIKIDENVNEPEEEQMVLIRAQYETSDDFVDQSQVIEDEPLKTEATYDEEWLFEDEAEEHGDETTREVYEELPKQVIKYEMEICEDIMSTNNISQEETTTSNMPLSRQSKRSPITKNVVLTPNTEGQYECPECPKMYSTRSAINKHIYRVHSPVTEKCPICHKVFNAYKLQCHMHYHRLQHKCGICEKR